MIMGYYSINNVHLERIDDSISWLLWMSADEIEAYLKTPRHQTLSHETWPLQLVVIFCFVHMFCMNASSALLHDTIMDMFDYNDN